MVSRKTPQIPLLFLTLSLIGLGLLPGIVFTANLPIVEFGYGHLIVGSLFIVLCALGILAGLFPTQCQKGGIPRRIETSSPDPLESTTITPTPLRQGHHPTCGHFTNHVLRIGDKTYCAGCTGLVTGALLAIAGSVLYFYFGVFPGDPTVGFWVGFGGVILGLLQHPLYNSFKMDYGFIRTLVNIVFVGGAFLLLASTQEILQSIEVAFYILALMVFWIYTRILLSSRSHKQVCGVCGLEPCQYM